MVARCTTMMIAVKQKTWTNTRAGTKNEKKEAFREMDQAEDDLNDEEASCREFGGPAGAVEVDLAGWAPADGVDACRRMTMRPSECAEKMASTTISSSTMFTAGRRDCRDRPGAGAAVCTPRDVCGWLTPALLRAPGRPWRGCGWGDSASIRSLRIRKKKKNSAIES
jgi:hypothetical protein